MTNYFWRRILIHGSAPSNNERTVFCILLLSLLGIDGVAGPCLNAKGGIGMKTMADLVMEMSERDAKLRLIELFGSILEVVDASSRDGRKCAIRWLEITAMKDGLLQQFRRDCALFDVEEQKRLAADGR